MILFFGVLEGNEREMSKKCVIALASEGRRLERFVLRLHGGRHGQAKDLYHTVKSHSVPNSGTNSGCRISKDSGACGLYPSYMKAESGAA